VWVLVVTLVISIALGMALFAIDARLNGAVIQHNRHQAYYTALSSLDTLSQWISDSDGSEAGAGAGAGAEAGAEAGAGAGAGAEAGTAHKATVEDFLAAIPDAMGDPADNPAGIDITLKDLPKGLGTCTVNLRFTDAQRQELLLTATATCDNMTEALTLTMYEEAGSGSFETSHKTSDFNTDTYHAKIAELNKKVVDTAPVHVGATYDARASGVIRTDDYDRARTAVIGAHNTTREAKVENINITAGGTTRFPDPDILSAFNMDANNATYLTAHQEDTRTVVTPPNGRLTVNPFRLDYYSRSTASRESAKTATFRQNARFVSLDISQTADKDVELRLGGDERNGEKYASILAFDFLDQNTGDNTTPNDYVEYLPNNRMLKTVLSKNASGTIQDSVAIAYNSDLRQDYWYRQKWKSGTIYTQDTAHPTLNGGLQGWLLFVPFYHGYIDGSEAAPNGSSGSNWINGFYDFWSWGAHVTNPNYGQAKGDAFAAFPEFSEVVGRNKRGMPAYPVYWGENFSLYLLDNVAPTNALKADRTYKANRAWLQQGVNILGTPTQHSTVYSVRGMTIGATQRRTAADTSAEGINAETNLVGYYMSEDPDNASEAYFAQLRWGTLLYETDIVLMTPDGTNTPRTSAIRRPLRYHDVYQSGNGTAAEKKFWRTFESYFLPKTQIIGGRIYVGAGQDLTIEGGTQLYRNPSGTEWSPTKVGMNLQATGEYTMHVAPEDITVAPGGTLTIEASENININTDIYVDGGTLVIKPNAKIKGNIYCYNNGTVRVLGDFSLYSPNDDGFPSLTAAEAHDGIHIYGKDLVTEDSAITAAGKLRLPSAAAAATIKISGSANKVHLLGSLTELVKAEDGSTLSYSSIKHLLCDDHGSGNGTCQHYGIKPSEWLTGKYGAG
jgi:hypothetical protein